MYVQHSTNAQDTCLVEKCDTTTISACQSPPPPPTHTHPPPAENSDTDTPARRLISTGNLQQINRPAITQ